MSTTRAQMIRQDVKSPLESICTTNDAEMKNMRGLKVFVYRITPCLQMRKMADR